MPDQTASLQQKPITIAVLAMGGQGGGVLTDWIVGLAERSGWYAQATSVPGVAQRTGATIYYIELLPQSGTRNRASPVLALTPVPGDVDIVIAAELVEAGRAMQRGLVTPDKTTLIASSHRAYSVQEKIVPGDGTIDPAQVIAAGNVAARRFLFFDMAQEAEKNRSVISSVLFGALAGAKALPFPRAAFEETIRAGGVGIEASLRAFASGHERAQLPSALVVAGKALPAPPESAGHPQLDPLLARVRGEFPHRIQPMLYAGLRRAVDFQDTAYGALYLDRIAGLLSLDGEATDYALSEEAAKQVAVAMCYDDVIRVADLKTRSRRFARVRDEVGAEDDQLVYTTEYMHPRIEEVCGTLPAWLGRAVENRAWLFHWLGRRIDRGRRVRTGTIRWFVVLYLLAGMRRFRRGTLRHARETEQIESWLDLVRRFAPADYPLAVEIVKCRRLVKGYSDTNIRGRGKFDRVVAAALALAGRDDAADWVRRLRQAALADEEGKALDGAIATINSFLVSP